MKTKNQSNVERRAEFASELIEKLSVKFYPKYW